MKSQKQFILLTSHTANSSQNILESGAQFFTIVGGITAIIGVAIACRQLIGLANSLKIAAESLQQQKKDIQLTAKSLEIAAESLRIQSESLNKQMENSSNEFERMRRETAINHAIRWTTDMDLELSSASPIAETLDSTQAKALFAFEEVIINKDCDKFLRDIVDKDFKFEDHYTPDQKFIKLPKLESNKLRFYVTAWLNMLEGILMSYRNGVADKEIIKEEFSFILDPKKNQFILQDVYDVAGNTKTFPGIAVFLKDIMPSNQVPEGKAYIS